MAKENRVNGSIEVDDFSVDDVVDDLHKDELKKWHRASRKTEDKFVETYHSFAQSPNPDIRKEASKYTDEYFKAQNKKRRRSGEFKGITESTLSTDEYGFNTTAYQLGSRTEINYKSLRRLAHYPLVRSIILTRKSQILPFLKPSDNIFSPGFQVKKRENYYSKNRKPVLSERLTRFMMDGGDKGYSPHASDRFQSFIMKMVDDSLMFDQATFEIEFSAETGRPCCFRHLPGESIEIIPEKRRKQFKPMGSDYPKYVQIESGIPRVFFYEWELGFGVRNHNTAINSLGYGVSEVETLSNNIRNLQRFEVFAQGNFTNGAIPRGILVLKSDGPSGEVFNETMSRKLGGAWQNGYIPSVHSSDGVEFLQLQASMRDLEYGEYFKLLLAVTCSCFKISPEEIGFRSDSGYESSRSVRGMQGEREHSQDKGLVPLLDNIAAWINEKIIWPKTDGEYSFCFTGTNKDALFNLSDTVSKLTATCLTVNEGREVLSGVLGRLDPLPEGDAVANSILAQEKANIMTQLSGSSPYVEKQPEEEMGGSPAEKPTNTSTSRGENTSKNSGADADNAKKNKKQTKDRKQEFK